MKDYNASDYIYFVYNKAYAAGDGFATYQDMVGAVKDKNGVGHPGSVVYISYRTDRNNKDEPYYFNWSLRDRTIRVHKNQKDKNGVNVVEFLRNSPECKGSPNGSYVNGTQVNVTFKEFNEESDAEKILQAKSFRIEAENIAANLSDAEVLELAPFFGQFTTSPTMARVAIMEAAGNKPPIFMEVYNNPQRRSQSLVRRGINTGVLKVNGTIITWNKTHLGMDEAEAAAKIQSDKDLLAALELAVKRAI